MNLKHIFTIIKKGIKMGPQNPMFIFGLVIPIVLTLILQLLFGNLWKQKPQLAIYEKGEKIITAELKKNEAIDVVEVQSENEVQKEVESKKADVGASFPEELKEKLKTKEKIVLKIYISGESLAKDRTIAQASIVSALREVSPKPPSVNFQQVQLGEERAVSILELLLPLIVLIAILFGAFFIPATFLVQEKEKKTLTALLITPVTIGEILVAFGLLGIFIAVLMGTVVLFLNIGLNLPSILFLALFLGTILMTEWGLTAGLIFKDMNSLFVNMKLFGILFYAPAIVLMFPNWPQWIGKIFPTYYIVHPVSRISIFGEGWSEIGWEILVLIGLIIIFLFPLIPLSKRLQKAL
ncbi:MAG: ABC transporter permease [Candidatus Aenigmarchaeota archaeon]|nr:ABC transporter permease [Candidatus Aenigmarchaeota archaeon]